MSWFLIIISFVFFLLRLPSLLEPHWYVDEGIYQAIGMSINNGSLLYKDIWDNKPPFLYLLYAIFRSDQFTVRFVSLIFGLLSVIVFFFLSKKLFSGPPGSTKVHFLTTTIFALLFGLPIVEGNIANAENFMLLPILITALLIFSMSSRKFKLFLAGILVSLAFLFKIVAVFDFLAFLTFFFILNLPLKFNVSLKKEKKFLVTFAQKAAPYIFGFLIPIFIVILFFLINGAIADLFKATFSSNVGYVGWKNKLIIPQGLLIVKSILLLTSIVFIAKKRELLDKKLIFILLWFVFSLFNAFFSERPYTHYLLVLIPSFSLMLGFLFWKNSFRRLMAALLVVSIVLVFKNFDFYKKTVVYYQNFTSFVLGAKSVSSYRAFFDKRTPIDYEIAMYIKSKIRKKDSIFVWGNNAQLYKMIERVPPGKYIVAYHITGYKDGLENTKEAVDSVKPRFIIIMPDQKPIPFALNRYSERFNINRVVIYESLF